MKVIFGDLLPGETPIDDSTGLKIPGITTRKELNEVEAEGIRKTLRKYFGVDVLTREIAPFDFDWTQRLHGEMFEDDWDWAGIFRLKNLAVLSAIL
jgi:fido (protein-threonine AMPylation protein)